MKVIRVARRTTIVLSHLLVARAFVTTPALTRLYCVPSVTMSTTAESSAEMPSEQVLEHVLQVAIDASKKAGETTLGNAGGAEVAQRKANSRDLLALVDPLCEKVGSLLHRLVF